jgi:hypothetical protein
VQQFPHWPQPLFRGNQLNGFTYIEGTAAALFRQAKEKALAFQPAPLSKFEKLLQSSD